MLKICGSIVTGILQYAWGTSSIAISATGLESDLKKVVFPAHCGPIVWNKQSIVECAWNFVNSQSKEDKAWGLHPAWWKSFSLSCHYVTWSDKLLSLKLYTDAQQSWIWILMCICKSESCKSESEPEPEMRQIFRGWGQGGRWWNFHFSQYGKINRRFIFGDFFINGSGFIRSICSCLCVDLHENQHWE